MSKGKLPQHSRKNTTLVKPKKNRRPKLDYKSSSETSQTYSTSAVAHVRSCRTSVNTEDTLSMISTPWSTDYNSYASSITNPIHCLRKSTESLLPLSTTIAGVPSPENQSIKTTVTLYNVPSVASEPESTFKFPKAKIPRMNKHSSDTLSSWTIETFTSNGLLSESCKLKAKYPWSPSSSVSGTDIYPTTVDTLVSRKGSRESSLGFGAVASGDKMAPMNYAKENNSEDDFLLDSIMIKAKGVPIIWHYN